MTPTLPQATGRLTWLPLCEYKGDGRVVSLTQAGKEIQVFSLHLFVLVLGLGFGLGFGLDFVLVLVLGPCHVLALHKR